MVGLPSPGAQFALNGFVVLPRAFTPDEVHDLRTDALRVVEQRGVAFGLGEVLPNAAVEAPAVTRAFHHPAVLAAVRDVLDAPRPVFTMEAGVHRNVTGPWHKDLGEHTVEGGYYGCVDPWARDDCRVVKVAIYLQDHTRGGGLLVRPGSHRVADLARGTAVELRTEAGDVVVFDARLTHRGVAPSATDRAIAGGARLLPRSRRGDAVARIRAGFNRAGGRRDRVALFFAYGPPGERTVTYARRNLARERSQTGRIGGAIDPGLAAALGAADVEVVDH